jgi:hypothetical protein
MSFMVVNAAMVLVQFATTSHEWHRWEFVSLLMAGAVSSRLKVKLPGLNGNMSVNLPFIFIAITQLSLAEAVMVAFISVFVQSIPEEPQKFVPMHVVFNVSNAIVAAGLGWNAFHFASATQLQVAALTLACATHLLACTVPVAMVISLAENRQMFRTWNDIFHLSFPYYVASAGVTSIVAGVGGHATWPTLLGVACVMFVVYRSYRVYFSTMQKAQTEQVPALAKAAAAAQ